MRATTVWKQPRAWIVVVLGSLLAALATVSYLGPAADPEGHLHGLPLVLVSEDAGATGPTGAMNLGRQVTQKVTAADARDDRVEWTVVPTRAAAEKALAREDAYAALVVPGDFSRRSLSLLGAGQDVRRPVLEVLSHRGVGPMAASMADKAVRQAAAAVSQQVGPQLSTQAANSAAQSAQAAEPATKDTGAAESTTKDAQTAQPAAKNAPTAPTAPGFLALLRDPVEVKATVQQTAGGSAGSTSGTIPLYFTVALLISGLLPATLLTMLVDARLGYLPLEIGPRRLLRPVVRISRSATFLAKALLGTVMGFAAGAVVAAVGLSSTGIDTPAQAELVLFCGAACAATALVTLALFAVFGMPGQVLALLLITLVGIPLSGGAIPVEALPGTLDTLGGLLPARHVADGVRSLMFFDDDGIRSSRAWAVLAAYAAGAVVVGLGLSHWYDRRGYHRARAHEFQPAAQPEPALS
ncbi:ABC transporter permease [Streptomyces sp. NPDC088794]|uniref:YhgE/Pip domain-containing protein n=1 Tax=Streptomyces sp. NPDC088794 TaxID=3365902 RepID=UPI0038136C39